MKHHLSKISDTTENRQGSDKESSATQYESLAVLIELQWTGKGTPTVTLAANGVASRIGLASEQGLKAGWFAWGAGTRGWLGAGGRSAV